MKVLFGLTLRQTTGFVANLLQRIDVAWTVPAFERHQTTLKVNISCRGSQGKLSPRAVFLS